MMSDDKSDDRLLPIMKLRRRVEAATTEIHNAVCFHEVWYPAVHDKALLSRIDDSYAANSLLIIHNALWREMVLSLMKIWDEDKNTISIRSISNLLSDRRIQCVLEQIVIDGRRRAGFFGDQPTEEDRERLLKRDEPDLRAHVSAEIKSCLEKISDYRTGPKKPVLDKMTYLRNCFLAHHKINAPAERHKEMAATSEELNMFFEDTRILVEHLYALTHRISRDFQDDRHIVSRYAAAFWAGVIGENRAGHPGYQIPPRKVGRHTPKPPFVDDAE